MFRLMDAIRTTGVTTLMILTAGLLASCATPKPGTPEAEMAKEEARVEAMEETLSDLPSWYLNVPQDDNKVYAVGTATSRDLQLALDKSILNAKRSLADRINGVLSSKMKSFVSEVGSGEDTEVISEVERVTTSLITEVNVAGYIQKDAKLMSKGGEYRSFVLLEYPLGSANRILVDQVKKNQILNTRLRSSKAFQDLEDEIKKARES